MKYIILSSVFLTTLSSKPLASGKNFCDEVAEKIDYETMVSWWSNNWDSFNGAFKPIAVLSNGKLLDAAGSLISEGDIYYSIPSYESQLVVRRVHENSYHLRAEDGFCQFSADVEMGTKQTGLLYSSNKNIAFRAPTTHETNIFNKHIMPISYCANHSGLPPLKYIPKDEIPPCEKAELVAISDIDKNSIPEFWATDVFRYGTGIAVWEFDGKNVIELIKTCPGCGD